MHRSHLFAPTRREVAADLGSANAELLTRAGYIRTAAAGVPIYLPLGLRVLEKIARIVREEMDALGGQEVIMSALQPKELWEETGRWQKLGQNDVMYQFKDRSERETGLGMTHEEMAISLIRDAQPSYKDLPLAIYQIQKKFRDEARAKAGLLRGREFIMKDMYSFHVSEADLEAFYKQAISSYLKAYERIGLPVIATIASGGVFTENHSHEFQTITEVGEDTIYTCAKCNQAINDEIIANFPDGCPNCHAELKPERAIEVGNIFRFGTGYSEQMGLTYTTETGGREHVWMGSYGIGISRVMGTVVEVSHDERGIIWPRSIAPFDVHLLDFTKDGQGEKVAHQMKAAGLDVLLDDRPVSAGEKLAEADLFGIPYRAIISEKTAGQIELKARTAPDARVMLLTEVISTLKR